MYTKSVVIHVSEGKVKSLQESSQELFEQGHIDDFTNNVIHISSRVVGEEIELRAPVVESWLAFVRAYRDHIQNEEVINVVDYLYGACQVLSCKSK